MSDPWVEKISDDASKISKKTRDEYVNRILKGESSSVVQSSLNLTNDQACGITYLFARGDDEPTGNKT